MIQLLFETDHVFVENLLLYFNVLFREFSVYCIPIELKNKFKEMTEDMLSIIWNATNEEYFQKAELFDSTFESYRLDKPINQYHFTDLQEIEE